MGNEQKIETELLNTLQELKYDYRDDIKDRAALESNFREKFEALNKVHLTNSEFARLLEHIITPDVFTASKTLRSLNDFLREDETPLNYTLVNIKDWCKNTFEVVNQLRMNTANSHHRYDVVLLINGVPLVHIELKNRAVSPQKAMQQIVQYKDDYGSGYSRTLMCFMQIFIVSNDTTTWYFSNNNKRHFAFDVDEHFLPRYTFADQNNNKITQLNSFAKAFLAKCALGETISRYMVLVASEQKLLMMRPYQIYAVKRIVESIHNNCGNGYIWHTTGSGKTLTSFKASTLLKDNASIEKCLFVVDRKDLDRQTREEFNRFQEGCVEENTNTEALVEHLLSDDYADKVIVTTIQKLGLALSETNTRNYKKRLEPLRSKRLVFIFDECHRSQFGDNHKAIKEFFPKSQLFGFTGTPIFADNAAHITIDGEEASRKTTADLFHNELHTYTITQAIEDDNVLRFHVDHYQPEGANSPRPGTHAAKEAIVKTILKKHNAMTHNRKFNALLATAGINDAIDYYNLFKEIQKHRKTDDDNFRPLNIACVFSPPAQGSSPENAKDITQIQEDLPQEKKDNAVEPEKKKKALMSIIADYNARYNTNHSINTFDLYYQDVQKRIKDQQFSNSDLPHDEKVDIVIVVDMLLTGFDSKFLNTLYVDKNLKYQGIIQAFSRTNRILNATKPFGNILDFRQQQNAVNAAIVLYSGEAGERAKEIWLVDEAPTVIEKLEQALTELSNFMRSQGLECNPSEASNLKGNAARGQFINLFKEVQRRATELDQYTDLTEEHRESIDNAISPENLQGFRGVYLDMARTLKEQRDGGGEPDDPDTNDLDFEFVLFASALIDYDYIMKLIAEYTNAPPEKQKMNREQLLGLIQADAKFLDDRDDIADYIDTLAVGEGLSEKQITDGYEAFKNRKNEDKLANIAATYGIKNTDLQKLVALILRRMIFNDEDLTALFMPLELGWKERGRKKQAMMRELIPILRKQARGREISGLDVYD
ncbi:MAG: type I restriction endonuclease subunit R [Salinispira sp.]